MTPRIDSAPRAVAGPAVRARAVPAARTDWARSVGLLAVATIAIGLANYVMSLAAVRLLPATQFADFAAGQGLLLVLGTGSFAALPWAVARFLARSDRPRAAGEAMAFGLLGSIAQAVVLAPVAFVVCWSLAGVWFGLSGALAAALISLLAGPVGFLQGRNLLPAIAAVRAIETAVRIAVSLLLVLVLSRHAAVVLIGFPAGSAVALLYALRRGRSGFPLARVDRRLALRLTREAALLGAIQVLLAMLGALDTVYADGGSFTATQAAGYQAAALLARIPLFFSAAVATGCYTPIAAAPDERDAGRQLSAALRAYAWLAVPFLVAYLTVPRALLDVLVPARYDQALPTLRVLCVAGVAVGAINVVTTLHQARARFRACCWILVGAVVAQAAALQTLARLGRLAMFTGAASAVAVLALLALLVHARHWLVRPVATLRWQAVVAAGAALVAALVPRPLVWIPALALVGAMSVLLAFAAPTRRAAAHARPRGALPVPAALTVPATSTFPDPHRASPTTELSR